MAPYEAPTTQAEFLSTLSLRRATEPQNEIIAYDNDFYPRSPCGERPSNINSSSIIAYFYPRSPCGERPASGFLSDTSDVISIHALLAESDFLIISGQVPAFYFYPRSPCGERRLFYVI